MTRPAALAPMALRTGATVAIDGWPDQAMGAAEVVVEETAVVASRASGPWLGWDGATASAGALGILFDDVLGSAIMRDDGETATAVSTEITIDALAPVPVDGTVLNARAERKHVDERGGFATAEVRTASGLLVAVATSRGRRLLPGQHRHSVHESPPLVPDHSGTVERLLWPDGDGPQLVDTDATLAVGPRLVNRFGILHGGISMLLADHLATTAVRRAGSDLAVASLHIAYLRPVPVGTTLHLDVATLHRGRSSGIVRVTGRDPRGRLATDATVTLH